MTTADLLEDVEFLLAAGESPLMVMKVVHRTAGAISHMARRHGKPDLATRFERVDRDEQRRRRAA